MRTKKDKGYLAEMAFATKAMSLGFNVCKPLGETPGFDFVLENGRAVHKVQVKSGWVEWHGGYPVKISSGTRAYRRDDTDFIVVYIVPEDAWYVMPIEAVCEGGAGVKSRHPERGAPSSCRAKDLGELPRRSAKRASKLRPAPRMASFYPHITNSRGRLEIYRDAWHLLGRPWRAGRKAQLSGNLPHRELSKRNLERARDEKKLTKELPYRRARAAWEALGTWLFSEHQ